ncbi:MAG TPA: FHA domain-containing protein [Armatimonadota bacterium]|jgi:hypothetical protein
MQGAACKLPAAGPPKAGWALIVEDEATGNAARLPLPPTAQPSIRVAPGDFSLIAEVRYQIRDAGRIPSTAKVTLHPSTGSDRTVNVTPADKGTAVFRDVPAGAASFTIREVRRKPRTALVDLPLTRKSPILLLPSAADAASPDAPTRPRPVARPGILSGALGFLIALAVLAAATALAVRSLRQRGVTAESALLKLGIQLPDQPEDIPTVAAPPPPPPDPSVCQFCGARKEPGAACANCEVGSAAPQPFARSAGQKRLVVVAGPRMGETIPLSTSLSIGRDPACDLAIVDDSALSRRHASIEMSAAGAEIADLGSSNGAFVNGRRVQRQSLRAGDEITLGASRFRYEE